jgi:hypothetical protein
MLFGFLPRLAHDELKQHISSKLAAKKTIDTLNVPTEPPEAVQAYNSIKTALQNAENGIQTCVEKIMAGAKIFLGGGNEVSGLELIDKIKEASIAALQRLFTDFNSADYANWAAVLTRARSGDVGALQAIGYQGEAVRQPACKKIYESIGAGKKGKEIRENFKISPYGWPQDAVDAALVLLTLSGNLRATVNGLPTDAKVLNQTNIGNASFQVDVPPLSVSQRLDLKALFQKLGVATISGQESAAAAVFLAKLIELAASAGGESPLPEKSSGQNIRELQTFGGNAQLLEIHNNKDNLAASIIEWSKIKDGIAKRLPRWSRLRELYALAFGLPEVVEIGNSINGLESSRGLLVEPDPLPSLIQSTLDILRKALTTLQAELQSTYQTQKSKLEANASWQELNDEQKERLIQQYNLKLPGDVKVNTEEEILLTLREASISNRRMLIEALPQRFQNALQEANHILEPKATHITLSSATIRNEKELDQWLSQTRQAVTDKLKEGPVII